MKKNKIRPLALCVFRRNDEIFVSEGYDSVKDSVYYRPIGGGIDFGETSRDAVIREVREEMNADITDVRLLGYMENLFTYEGQPGHEIVAMYEARFVEPRLYEGDTFTGYEAGDESHFTVVWKPLAFFERGEAPLYPDGLLTLLQSQG